MSVETVIGTLSSGLTLIERIVAAMGLGKPEVRARYLVRRALRLQAKKKHDRARPLVEEALAIMIMEQVDKAQIDAVRSLLKHENQ